MKIKSIKKLDTKYNHVYSPMNVSKNHNYLAFSGEGDTPAVVNRNCG